MSDQVDIKIGDVVMAILGPVSKYAGTVIAIKHEGKHRIAIFQDEDGAVYETPVYNLTKEVPPKGRYPRKNPKAGTEGLHFVVTQDDAGDTVLHVFDSEDQAGLYHGQLRGYGGVKRIGRAKGSKGMSLGQVNERVLKQFGAEPRMIRHDLGETNPVRPRKGEKARDFIARCMSEEHSSFPEPKQRIAVCLSKSRKRNPVYDTGCDE